MSKLLPTTAPSANQRGTTVSLARPLPHQRRRSVPTALCQRVEARDTAPPVVEALCTSLGRDDASTVSSNDSPQVSAPAALANRGWEAINPQQPGRDQNQGTVPSRVQAWVGAGQRPLWAAVSARTPRPRPSTPSEPVPPAKTAFSIAPCRLLGAITTSCCTWCLSNYAPESSSWSSGWGWATQIASKIWLAPHCRCATSCLLSDHCYL